ncbi:hypothetical protein ACIGHG_19030 [Bacillus sp. NPDC077411]|uniref:NAD(P)/FAD-dependent oxidoreductase n=1 Tax=Bacillus bruguierae TaxID=3127667 RepID=A0ABU8FID3_9BACI
MKHIVILGGGFAGINLVNYPPLNDLTVCLKWGLQKSKDFLFYC